MKVIIQKVDLDTALTAFIAGVSHEDEVINVHGNASEEYLMDSSILCIECGGSGATELLNFDHHDPERWFPPACKQAFDFFGKDDPLLKRLVEYVCIVDDRLEDYPSISFPSLSNVFSGMLFTEKDPVKQLFKGMEILKRVLICGFDPFLTMPEIPDWQSYIEAKKENMERLKDVVENVRFFDSRGGCRIGFIESSVIGGIGKLYQMGCHVVVMFNPSFGDPPGRKFTIAGNGKNIVHLIRFFDNMEKGWGGRETIIGSPAKGSSLQVEEVLKVVVENL